MNSHAPRFQAMLTHSFIAGLTCLQKAVKLFRSCPPVPRSCQSMLQILKFPDPQGQIRTVQHLPSQLQECLWDVCATVGRVAREHQRTHVCKEHTPGNCPEAPTWVIQVVSLLTIAQSQRLIS